MENTVFQQTYLLGIYLVSGFIIGILFDIFRVLRKSFKTSDIITYIEDIFFCIITGIYLIIVFFKFSSGQIRIYNIIGLLLGILIYMLVLSKTFIKTNVKITMFLKKIFEKILHIILIIINFFINILKKIFKPFTFFVINFKKIFKKRRILTKKVE